MKNEDISYVSLALCFGVTFGLVFNNLTIGICIGLAVGSILDIKKNK